MVDLVDALLVCLLPYSGVFSQNSAVQHFFSGNIVKRAFTLYLESSVT